MSSPMAWRQSRPMVSLVSAGKRPVADPRAATTKPPGFGGVIRVQALTSCRWYTRSCRKQRPSESAANAEPFEHWPGRDHWSRSTLSKLRAIISAAAASSAETTACSCDQ